MGLTYDEVLDKARALHHAKDADYAGAAAYGNFLRAEDFGVPAWVGALVRLSDKMERIKVLTKRSLATGEGPRVVDESLEDTLLDMVNYAAITLVLRNTAQATSNGLTLQTLTSV